MTSESLKKCPDSCIPDLKRRVGSDMMGILNSLNGVNVTQSLSLEGVNGNQYAKQNGKTGRDDP